MNPTCWTSGVPYDQCACADCVHLRVVQMQKILQSAMPKVPKPTPEAEGADQLVTDIEVGRYALRTFNMREGKLGSLFQTHTWDNGVAVAKCYKERSTRYTYGGERVEHPTHEAPNEDCRCGLYGTLTLDQLLIEYGKQATHCVAVIAAEGTTYIGTKGLRTAAARIVAYWTAVPSLPAVPDGPDATVMGPFWRQGDGYLDQPSTSKVGDLLPPEDPMLEVFKAECPDAKHFTDIHEMLAEYKFPAFEGLVPSPPPLRRTRPPRASITSSPASASALASMSLPMKVTWDKIAPYMGAATPGGIAAVKYVLGLASSS